MFMICFVKQYITYQLFLFYQGKIPVVFTRTKENMTASTMLQYYILHQQVSQSADKRLSVHFIEVNAVARSQIFQDCKQGDEQVTVCNYTCGHQDKTW